MREGERERRLRPREGERRGERERERECLPREKEILLIEERDANLLLAKEGRGEARRRETGISIKN